MPDNILTNTPQFSWPISDTKGASDPRLRFQPYDFVTHPALSADAPTPAPPVIAAGAPVRTGNEASDAPGRPGAPKTPYDFTPPTYEQVPPPSAWESLAHATNNPWVSGIASLIGSSDRSKSAAVEERNRVKRQGYLDRMASEQLRELSGQREAAEGLKKSQESAVPSEIALREAQTQAIVSPKPPTVEQEFAPFYKAFIGASGQQPNPGAELRARREFYQRARAVNTRQEDKDLARADKSYQFSSQEIGKIGGTLETTLARLTRLQDTINQVSPQADALIAPELLTVMAGGQGSGLRMNEAEIARIIGGRTNLEAIKAALNKWQMDPTKGLSVTPAQRTQIRNLVQTVYTRLVKKQRSLNRGYEDLLDTDDPAEHRRIVARTRVAASESPQGDSNDTVTMRAPTGEVQQVPASEVERAKSLGAVVVEQ